MGRKKKNGMDLANDLIRLEQEADLLAHKGDWKAVGLLNGKIAEVESAMIKEGVSPTEIRRTCGRPVPKIKATDLSSGELLDKLKGGSKGVSSKTIDWKDEWLDTGWGSKKSKSSDKGWTKCAHSHPLLVIGEEKLEIQGGSAYSPQGKYDVEIALCGGAKTPDLLLPWGTQYVRFPITDMCAPTDKATFDKLVDWTIEQMRAGKKVHVGCIGGHGRTGLFLSVLVNRITGQKDSTAWLRANYCKKAVESKTQIEWLFKEYGIERVEASKKWADSTLAKSKKDKHDTSLVSFGGQGSKAPDIAIPLPGRSVWGETKLI